MRCKRVAVVAGAAAALTSGAIFASASAGEISARIDNRLDVMIDSRVDVIQVAQANLADRLIANLPGGVTLETATAEQLEAMFAIVRALEPTITTAELAAAAAAVVPARQEEIAAIAAIVEAAARGLDPTDPDVQDEIDDIANEIGTAVAEAVGADDVQREILVAAANAGALAGVFLPAAGDVQQIALGGPRDASGLDPFQTEVIQRDSEEREETPALSLFQTRVDDDEGSPT